MRKQISISLSEREFSRLDDMCVRFGKMRAEFIRSAIDEAINKLERHLPQGPAPSKIAKIERDEHLDAIMKMTPLQMTEELHRIGYFNDPSRTYWVGESATTPGKLVVWCKYGGLSYEEPFNIHLKKIKDKLKEFYNG